MRAPFARGAQGEKGRENLRLLARRIHGILARGSGGRPGAPAVIPTGWAGSDAALAARAGNPLARGGLHGGAIHEWFGVGDPEAPRPDDRARQARSWSLPLSLLAHLAWQALESVEEGSGRVLWIGRRVWPYPRALVRDFVVRPSDAAGPAAPETTDTLHSESLELARLPRCKRPEDVSLLLSRSLLVDAARPASRLWAIDVALRCPSVVAVVADASEFDMAATRRLQLAARAGQGFGLLVRRPAEEGVLSAASTRWRVRRSRAREGVSGPRWTLDLLRCKGSLGYGGDRSVRCTGSSR